MRLQIFVADDHPVVRVGTRALIEGSGVGTVVGEAESPDELLRELAQVRCDVLVTDFAMPGPGQADGQGMIGLVRRQHPGLPIIVMTTVARVDTFRALLAAGVRGLVEKNAATGELPQALLTVARGGTYVSNELQARMQQVDGRLLADARPLSPREAEVVRLLGTGLTVTVISERLHRSVTTISRQKKDAMRKLGIDNDMDLFDYAKASGMVP